MDENLFQVRKDDKSGFINDKGQVIIDLVFDGVSSFSEGLARIFVDGKIGFIDNQGDIKIKPKFDTASDFSEGFAYATIGDKYGYIDTDGNFAIKPKFYRCWDFENGIALVMHEVVSTGCFIDKLGDIKLNGRNFLVSKFREGLINCSENGSWASSTSTAILLSHQLTNTQENFQKAKQQCLQKRSTAKRTKRISMHLLIRTMK